MRRPAPSLRPLASWLALALGFSPALVELARHLLAAPIDRYALLAPILLLLAVRAEREHEARPRRDGWPLLVLGVGLELAGIAVDTDSAMRLGLALGVVGMARRLGRPSWRASVLALGVVPLPVSLLDLASPELEEVLAWAAARADSALGLPVAAAGSALRADALLLPLRSDHSGLPLAWVCAELAWFAGHRLRWSVRASVSAVLAAGLAAFPIQLLVVTAAGAALALGAPEPARALLDGAWLAVAAALLLAILRAAAGPGPRAPGRARTSR